MNILAKHSKIAFDFDGTLVDGIASKAISTFIKTNPKKSFFIVTFRTPNQTNTIPAELTASGLDVRYFRKVIPMPERMSSEFEDDQLNRRFFGLPPMESVPTSDLLPAEFRFVHWKGFVARKIGATALVDDMASLVIPGCRKNNVAYVDVKDLT